MKSKRKLAILNIIREISNMTVICGIWAVLDELSSRCEIRYGSNGGGGVMTQGFYCTLCNHIQWQV